MRTLLVIIICFLLLLSLVIVATVISVREKYKEKIIAEIIEYEEYATDAYGKQYVAVLKYTYNGEEYIVKDRQRKFSDPNHGYKYNVVTIGVDPKEPTDFHVYASITEFELPSRDKKVIVLCGLGMLCIALGKFSQLLLILLLLGIVIYMVTEKYVHKPKANWIEIEAEIIETERRSTRGGTVLVHVYRYYYEGLEYKIMSNTPTYTGRGKIGSKIKLLIDSNNPLNIKEELKYKDLTPYAKWTIWFFGAFAIIIFILIAFVW